MEYTNDYGVPQTLLNAIRNDDYTRGRAHISATQLLDSARVRILKQRHKDEISKDITDAIWMLLGKGVHAVLEKAGDEEHIAEARLFAKVLGWIVSGGIDVQRLADGRIDVIDYKLTSVWTLIIPAQKGEEKSQWEDQLNLYAWLLRLAGFTIRKLEICALLRDWKRSEAETGRTKFYPERPIKVVPIRLWSFAEQQQYVEQRVMLHQNASMDNLMGLPLPECSEEERWLRGGDYAVMKVGAGPHDRPAKTAQTIDEANAWLATKKEPEKYEVRFRAGEPTRCDGNYCDVAQWCDQYKRWREDHPEKYQEKAKDDAAQVQDAEG